MQRNNINIPNLNDMVMNVINSHYKKENFLYYFYDGAVKDSPAIVELKRFCNTLSKDTPLVALLKLTRFCECNDLTKGKLANAILRNISKELTVIYQDQQLIPVSSKTSFVFLISDIFNDDNNIKLLSSNTKMFRHYVRHLNELRKGVSLTKEYFDMVFSMDEFTKPHGHCLPRIMSSHYYPSYVEMKRYIHIDEITLRVIYKALATCPLDEVSNEDGLLAKVPSLFNRLYACDLLTPEILRYVFKDYTFPCHVEKKVDFLIEINEKSPIAKDQFMLNVLKEDRLDLDNVDRKYFARLACSVQMLQLLFLASQSEGSIFSIISFDIVYKIVGADPGFPELKNNPSTLFQPKNSDAKPEQLDDVNQPGNQPGLSFSPV